MATVEEKVVAAERELAKTAKQPEREWLSAADLGRRWGIDNKAARKFVLELEKRAGQPMVFGRGGSQRAHIRVSATMLSNVFAYLMSPEYLAIAGEVLDHERRLAHVESLLNSRLSGDDTVPQDRQNEWDDAVELLDEQPATTRSRAAGALAETLREGSGELEPASRLRGFGDIGPMLANQTQRALSAGVRCTLRREEWIALVKAFDGRCAYCDRLANTLDHVIPISTGGAHAIDNVVPACFQCNLSKHAQDVVDWMERTGRPISETLDRIVRCQVIASQA